MLVVYLTISGFSFTNAQNLDNYVWEVYNDDNSYFKENFIKDIAFDDNWGSWIITTGDKLINWDNRKWKTVQFTDMDSTGLSHIAFDPKGRLYIANNSKIIHYNPRSGKTKYIQMPNGADAQKVYCNDKGILLIGCSLTSKEGFLYQYQKGEFKMFQAEYEDVFDVNFDDNQNAIVAYRHALCRYPVNTDGTYKDSLTKLSDKGFYKTIYDREGILWAAGFQQTHLFRFDGKKWESFPDAPRSMFYKNGIEMTYAIHDLCVLRSGKIAIATQVGCHVGVFDPVKKTWEAFDIPVKHKKDGIQEIAWSARGEIWCGTWQNGIGIFTPKVEKEQAFVKEGEKIPYIPDPERTVETKEEIKVKRNRILLYFRDSKKYDGDTLSLYLNGQPVLDNEALEPEFKMIQIELKKGRNELVLFAHNLGKIPPNTVDIRISMGRKSQDIILESDLTKCERLIFNRLR